MIKHEALWKVFHRFAETLVTDYSLAEAISLLALDAGEVMGLDGAGVMVENEAGELRFVSTSDPKLHELESLQLEFGEGPCLLAYRTGEEVRAPDLDGDDRFPRFAPAAVEDGMRAVHSFPLRVQDRVVGAFNAYAAEPNLLTEEQLEVGRTLATVAAAYLLHAVDLRESQRLTAQLQHALHSRVTIEQAKGFIAAAAGITIEQALESLRSYARTNQQRLHDCAEHVLAGELGVRDLGLAD